MVDPSWNSVRGMLSTSLLWGRFWCSRTIQIWSKVIPYCDNSAEKIDMSNRRHGGSWVEPLPISEKDWAGTWIERPQSISLCNRCVFVGWRHLKHTPSPCIYGMKILLEQQQTHKTNRRKFYICADGPHTRLAAARLFLRVTNGRGYYPFPEAEEASKYREETYV